MPGRDALAREIARLRDERLARGPHIPEDRVEFARGLGFEPDPWQALLLRSASDRILINCSRQSGKSTMSAIIGLHKALTSPGSLTLLLAPALRQSQELYAKISAFYRHLGAPIPTKSSTALSMELASGSRIISLPGSTDASIRGYSADLLIVDEGARVEDPVFYALTPMLAVTKGDMILLSTPWGRSGYFFREWHDEHGHWEKYHVDAEDLIETGRMSREFLEHERRIMYAPFFRQEYFGTFEESDEQLFTEAEIQGMLNPNAKMLFPPGEEPYKYAY